jgi:hypothetical protein
MRGIIARLSRIAAPGKLPSDLKGGPGANVIANSRPVITVQSFARPDDGLALNAGVAKGGAASILAPELASIEMDARPGWAAAPPLKGSWPGGGLAIPG